MAPSMFALQAIGTGLNVVSTLSEGRAARSQAAFDRAQLEFQRKQDEVVGLERVNLRNAQFDSNEAVNRATFFSGMGRDPNDRSLKAFFAKQKELAGKDVDAINSQTIISMGQNRMQQMAVTERGQAAYRASLLGAASAVSSGLFRYEEYRTTMSLFGDDE